MSTTAETTEPRPAAEILQSVRRLSAELRSSPRAALLEVDGIDTLEVLISPLFVDALNAVRTQRVPAPYSLRTRARSWAARLKQRWSERKLAAKASAVVPTDLLLWPREITHIEVLKRVAAELDASGVDFRVLTSLGKSFSEASAAGMRPALAPAAWPAEIRRAAVDGRRRAKQFAQLGPPEELGADDPEDRLIAASIHRTLGMHLASAWVAVATARAALDHFRPRALVVGNDITLEGRAACLEAARRGIPSAVFMHGNIAGGVLHGEHCADRLLVFGEAHRRVLMNLATNPERIVLCGAPQLDGRIRPTGKIDARLKSGLGLSDGQPWILVATSGPGDSVSHAHHAQVLEAVADLARALPEVPLVCKLHRKDRPENYRDFLDRCQGLRVTVVPRSNSAYPYDIFQWLEGCSLVLTGASTVAVEAMLMNVPVITMDFCRELRNIDFIDAGATVHVTSAAELQHAARAVLNSGLSPDAQARVRQYLEDAFFSLDGKSAERGAGVLMELVARNR